MKKPQIIFTALLVLFVAGIAQVASQMQGANSVSRVAAPRSKAFDAAKMLRDMETLAADDMQGRGVGTEGGKKAREFVRKRFAESGLKPFGASFVQPFEFASRKGEKIEAANVVGYVEGKKYKDKFIVISAHYDHVGTRGGEIYNGADDNASGTAALFALAKYFSEKRPAHSIIFVSFDAEETGLRGAREFVAEPPVEKGSILLNINMDMVSRSEKKELYAAGAFHYPHLKAPLEKAAKKAKVKLLLGHDRPELGKNDWTNQSDHAAFHAAKIPFVYFGVEDHEDYHRPGDDFDKINREFYVRAVETVLEAVKILDKHLSKTRS